MRCRDCKRAHQLANQAKYNEISRLNQIEYRIKLRAKVHAAYGGKCANCGSTDPNDWELDHVNEDGRPHRNAVGKGTAFYLHLQRSNWPMDPPLQILCVSCHRLKSKAKVSQDGGHSSLDTGNQPTGQP